jgi:hypothetical protein
MRKEHLLFQFNPLDTDIFEDMDESVKFIDAFDRRSKLEYMYGDFAIDDDHLEDGEEVLTRDELKWEINKVSLTTNWLNEQDIVDINQFTTYMRDLSTMSGFHNYYDFTTAEDIHVDVCPSGPFFQSSEIEYEDIFHILLHIYFIPSYFLGKRVYF